MLLVGLAKVIFCLLQKRLFCFVLRYCFIGYIWSLEVFHLSLCCLQVLISCILIYFQIVSFLSLTTLLTSSIQWLFFFIIIILILWCLPPIPHFFGTTEICSDLSLHTVKPFSSHQTFIMYRWCSEMYWKLSIKVDRHQSFTEIVSPLIGYHHGLWFSVHCGEYLWIIFVGAGFCISSSLEIEGSEFMRKLRRSCSFAKILSLCWLCHECLVMSAWNFPLEVTLQRHACVSHAAWHQLRILYRSCFDFSLDLVCGWVHTRKEKLSLSECVCVLNVQNSINCWKKI